MEKSISQRNYLSLRTLIKQDINTSFSSRTLKRITRQTENIRKEAINIKAEFKEVENRKNG